MCNPPAPPAHRPNPYPRHKHLVCFDQEVFPARLEIAPQAGLSFRILGCPPPWTIQRPPLWAPLSQPSTSHRLPPPWALQRPPLRAATHTHTHARTHTHITYTHAHTASSSAKPFRSRSPRTCCMSWERTSRTPNPRR